MPYIDGNGIYDVPILEFVPVVRCKDCKHYWKNSNDFNDSTVCLASPRDDAFCSEGERKEIEDGEIH